MEKCSFCVHRVRRGVRKAAREGRALEDGEIRTACQEACPTDALVFGDARDANSKVSRMKEDDRYYSLMPQFGTDPNVFYLAKVDEDREAEHAVEGSEGGDGHE